MWIYRFHRDSSLFYESTLLSLSDPLDPHFVWGALSTCKGQTSWFKSLLAYFGELGRRDPGRLNHQEKLPLLWFKLQHLVEILLFFPVEKKKMDLWIKSRPECFFKNHSKWFSPMFEISTSLKPGMRIMLMSDLKSTEKPVLIMKCWHNFIYSPSSRAVIIWKSKVQ